MNREPPMYRDVLGWCPRMQTGSNGNLKWNESCGADLRRVIYGSGPYPYIQSRPGNFGKGGGFHPQKDYIAGVIQINPFWSITLCNMNLRIIPIPVLFSIVFLFVSNHATSQNNLKIGWSQVDVTPDKPVLIAGQFHARVSEDVLDPITATVLVLESGDDASTSTKVVFVSCDLVGISDGTRDEKEKSLITTVRSMVSEKIPEIAGSDIIINATHSHSAPYCGTETDIQKRYGIALNAMSPYEYLQFMAGRVAAAVSEAWSVRKPGGVSYGTSHAVVGHNRLQSYLSGKSRMYGNTNDVEFSHIEGFEDH